MRKIFAFLIVVVAGAMSLAGCGAGSSSDSAGKDSTSVPTTVEVTTTTEVPTTEATTTTTTMPAKEALLGMSTEVDRACQEAVSAGRDPVIQYNPEWEAYFSEEELTERAKRCVDAKFAALKASEEQQAAAQAQAEIDNAQPVNVDEMIKNPDAFKGQVFVLVAEISQFDGATGPCSFRASWDNAPQDYSFDYAGDNAYFTSGDGESNCPVLTGIDQNDVVRLWVRSTGAYSYDTQIGGNTTAPGFDVLKASVISKN